MPDIREEFEAYIAGVRERVEARGFEPLGDAVEKWMFHAWQASRAALRVELPFPVIVDEGAEFAFHAYDKDEMDKALQQAGIEVK
ncbi:hypothetical protein HUK64_07430 [Pseudomonas aeruginosa]|uniref:hypothetical protein n=1 Tax=Pseudomonas aeruginosa TaxID=287 RepID=UPI0018E3D1E1|nr:hypothetical protein [Pseudomonas aeruginosa]QQD33690.1 hypothetical protein HUF09_17360 [Pseudomonas aeruginosa]UJB85246.1 hypothetical protein HUK64_07430 [Pseudomonas aeruginosa]UJB93127.1 hypothetical protein HUK67_17625 [Pseudomonas aeruginosa]